MINYSAGTLHPDENYQSVEPAHELVYGYGIKAWEWGKGIRSWFLPGIYSGIFLIGKFFNINDSLGLVFLIHFFNLLLSLVSVYAMFILGYQLGGKRSALIAGFLGALSFFIVKYSFRPLSEPISLNFLLLSLAFVYKGIGEEKKGLVAMAGVLLGLSFVIRFSNGVFFIPILVFLLFFQRKFFIPFCASFFLVLLLEGVLDYFTWGDFFHAPIEFFRFNILENKSSYFGTAPFGWYLNFLLHDKSWSILTVLFFVIGALRSGLLFFSFLVYIILFSAIPHKETRFLIPIIPICLVLISVGIGRFTSGLPKWRYVRSCAIVGLVILFMTYPTLKFKNDMKPDNYDIFLCMHLVGGQPDAKGLLYIGYWCNSGGYTYLHRDIPILFWVPDVCAPEVLDEILSRPEIIPKYGPYLLNVASYSRVATRDLNYAISEDMQLREPILKHGFVEFSRLGKAIIYKKK